MLLLQVGGRAAFVGVLSSFFHDGNDNILGATWVALNIHMRTCLKSLVFTSRKAGQHVLFCLVLVLVLQGTFV